MIRQNRSAGTRAPRRGITMIETLILVTCVAIMLGLVAVTIQVMLRLVADSQSRLSSSLMLERLARQLRSDVHRSQTAVVEGAAGKAAAPHAAVKLEPEPGRLVTYHMRGNSLDRDETAAGKRVRHESFVLPRGHHARFEPGVLAGRTTVSLWIEPGPESSPVGAVRALEVLAVVGKHRGVALAQKSEEPKP